LFALERVRGVISFDEEALQALTGNAAEELYLDLPENLKAYGQAKCVIHLFHV